ncbi:hypothetical protein AMTRI_Chr06g194920 [Amborella trichopoda]
MSEEGEMNPHQSAPSFLQMILENGKNSQRNGVEKEERESFRVLETELRLGPPGDYQALNCPSSVSKYGSFCGTKRGFQETVASKPATSERNQKFSGQETGLLRQQPAFSLYQKSLHQKNLNSSSIKTALAIDFNERKTALCSSSAPSNLNKPIIKFGRTSLVNSSDLTASCRTKRSSTTYRT